MDTVKLINKKNCKMIAHRGLSYIECENSMPAFVAAGNRSYYGIETDVHVTADGKFVIIHDDSTGRVAAGRDLSVEGNSFDLLRGVELADKNGLTGRTDLRDFYDVKILLNTDGESQRLRILERGGETLWHRYETEWLPLEAAYFEATQPQFVADLVIYT